MLQTTAHGPPSLSVLIIDDDEVDAESICRLLQPFSETFPTTCADNAEKAFAILRGEGGFQRLQRPYIILLDLHLPGVNGLEFLQALRRDPELTPSVVFVLGKAYIEMEKMAAYELCVAGYIAKERLRENPSGLIDLLDSYRQIVDMLPTA